MTTKQRHTPTPWVSFEDADGDIGIYGNNQIVSICFINEQLVDRYKYNAKFIVKAVNNHDKFIALLTHSLLLLNQLGNDGAIKELTNKISGVFKEIESE